MSKKSLDKLTNQIIVRMDDETKEAFMSKVKSEGKTASTVLMSFIRSYLADETMSFSETARIQVELEELKKRLSQVESELLGKSAA